MTKLSINACYVHGYSVLLTQPQWKKVEAVLEVAYKLANTDHYDLAGWAPIWDDFDEAVEALFPATK